MLRFRVLESRGMRVLASLKLTLGLMLLLLAAVGGVYFLESRQLRTGLAAPVLVPVLGLLGLNLVAAIVGNPRFRRQKPLLMFHLALLALVMLAGLGRLTYLRGSVEVTEGGDFTGTFTAVEAGPLHPWHGRSLRFTNEAFEVNYAPGPSRTQTYNRVSWRDRAGQAHRAVIGDQVPLRLEGYRFYTSHNKGFAPEFLWKPNDGPVQLGALHLPAWPANEFSQAIEWTPPGSDQKLWIQLDFDELILDPERPSTFHPPREHRLVVRVGDRRLELRPGDDLELARGILHYQGLKTWMGYKVYYDETRYWLLAACLLAVASIGWYFWDKFRRTPWTRPPTAEGGFAPRPREGLAPGVNPGRAHSGMARRPAVPDATEPQKDRNP